MCIDYRLIHAEEEDAALHFWAEMFNSDYATMQREFSTDHQRLEHTRVAVASDGTLIATASYCLRDLRDVDGTPRRVGVVWNVATRPDAQKQGHGGRLMKQTLEAMHQDGCAWSMLFTSEAGRSLYTRYGYREFPVLYRERTIATDRLPSTTDYTVRCYDPITEPGGWEALARVYNAFNAARPLTVVRDLPYWRSGYAAYKYSHWFAKFGAIVLGATCTADLRDLCGYVLVHYGKTGFQIFELGVLPDNVGAISALLSVVGDEATTRGLNQGRVYLPYEPQIDRALERLFEPPLKQGENGGLMARPIGSDCDEQHLDNLFATPGAIHWTIDEC